MHSEGTPSPHRFRSHPALCRFVILKAKPLKNPSLDFDRLLKLRLVVARVGEMDLTKWWNTNGQLGRLERQRSDEGSHFEERQR